MNQNQKMILVAVIVIIMGMIVYPPFQVVAKNGIVINMGYGLIIDPPKRGFITATVNVAMLLIQWVGVLIVGGIAFFMTKGASITNTTSPQQSTIVTPPIEIPKEETENLYKNILGEKNRDYYLTKFKEFDRQPPGLKASWNWAAFFAGGVWVLYRKMYGWFFVFSGIFFIAFGFAAFLEDTGFPVLGYLLPLGTWIAYTLFANSIYHSNVKKKIAVAQISIKDRSKLLEFLRQKGGVHTWVIWVSTLLPVAGIVIAIAIPNFIAYKERSQNTAAKLTIDELNAYERAANGYKTSLIPVDYDPFAEETARDGRFIAYDNGTVMDTQTNLRWAAKDNGSNINWVNAKSYCEKYRGGGYTDWRMPTKDELAGLYDTAKTYKSDCGYDVHLTELIRPTCTWAWASETRGSGAAVFGFGNGKRGWVPQSSDSVLRALPVRSGK